MNIPQAPAGRLPRPGESLFARAQKADYVIDEAGCWVWQKSALDGYGLCASGRAHRAYYERAHGPIPDDHDIHHRCHTTMCVNPDHLEAAHERAHDIESFLMSKGRTFEDVKAVRADRAGGMNMRAIAAKYELPFATVQDWCSAKRWHEFVGDAPVTLPDGVCGRPGCTNPVVRKYSNKRYCSSGCRSWVNQQKPEYKARKAAYQRRRRDALAQGREQP